MEQLRARTPAPPKVDDTQSQHHFHDARSQHDFQDVQSQHDFQKSTHVQGLQAPRAGGEEGGGATREALLEKLVWKDEENQVRCRTSSPRGRRFLMSEVPL